MKSMLIPSLLVVLLFSDCSKSSKTSGDDKPVTPPKETPNTPFKTLNYLYSISGEKTLSGIHNREPNATPARWTDEIYNTTGKYPALWSGDFLFQAENINNRQIMVNEAVTQWKKGAVINIMWHACNPALSQPCGWDDGKGVLSSLTDQQFTELTTDGTAINAKWKGMMDEVCLYLQQLKDKGVEVLWRPMHEMNQGKFWWAGRPGASGTVKLWKLTHDYMVKTKGLTNLIWVWDVQDFSTLSNDVKSYYPGDDYYDVAALDVYDGSGFTQAKYMAMVNIAGKKPIAIGECDKLPTEEELTYQPKWTFFMSWSELVFEKNTKEQLIKLYGSPKVQSLDKMPGW
ncbi:glycoside hydrolase [Pedobacter sp. HMF7647]|uniref:Glycoside hydrolase n=1 Tax=Hufsiella arboris TaxID=2695275 RepID=A0A7K1Y958_9SPHI|nr:glycoside hydrolase [Hufsiella arboris]